MISIAGGLKRYCPRPAHPAMRCSPGINHQPGLMPEGIHHTIWLESKMHSSSRDIRGSRQHAPVDDHVKWLHLRYGAAEKPQMQCTQATICINGNGKEQPSGNSPSNCGNLCVLPAGSPSIQATRPKKTFSSLVTYNPHRDFELWCKGGLTRMVDC